MGIVLAKEVPGRLPAHIGGQGDAVPAVTQGVQQTVFLPGMGHVIPGKTNLSGPDAGRLVGLELGINCAHVPVQGQGLALKRAPGKWGPSPKEQPLALWGPAKIVQDPLGV